MTTVSDQVVVASFLRETLIADAEMQSLIVDTDGQYKVFWEHVPDYTPFPYIVNSHIAGGAENTTQIESIDSYYKSVAYTADIAKAAVFANALKRILHRTYPISTTYAVGNGVNPEFTAYAKTLQTLPVFERDVVQNVPLYMVGGIYRVRLIENNQ